MVNNGFAYFFKEARLETTGGSDLEHNNYFGKSTFMRVLTSKDRDLLSYFEEVNETPGEINKTFLKHMLIDNHAEANRGKYKGQLTLNIYLAFAEHSKRLLKTLVFL